MSGWFSQLGLCDTSWRCVERREVSILGSFRSFEAILHVIRVGNSSGPLGDFANLLC